jgi:NAD(P)-dependent dehydrogenase (short-subunit alcohol dehydrogenase family)
VGTIESLSAEAWRAQLDTNVVGVAMTAKYALPHLRLSEGRLALVGSVSSMLASPKVGAYTASKYAVRAIGQTLQMELAGTGVSCTLLHPGFVESEIAQKKMDGPVDPAMRDTRPKRLMWTAEAAAKVMVRAVERRTAEYTFTGHGKVGAALGRHAPGLVRVLFSRAR